MKKTIIICKIYDKIVKFAHYHRILFFIFTYNNSKIDPLYSRDMQDYATMIKEGIPRNGKDTRISVLLNPRRKIKAPSPQTRSVISISASISTRRRLPGRSSSWQLRQRGVGSIRGSQCRVARRDREETRCCIFALRSSAGPLMCLSRIWIVEIGFCRFA